MTAIKQAFAAGECALPDGDEHADGRGVEEGKEGDARRKGEERGG